MSKSSFGLARVRIRVVRISEGPLNLVVSIYINYVHIHFSNFNGNVLFSVKYYVILVMNVPYSSPL